MSLASLASPIWQIVKDLGNALQIHIGYLKDFEENVGHLSRQTTDLKERREHLEDLVRYFMEEEPKRQINKWIKKAREIEEKAKKIEQNDQERKECLFCPNPIFLYCISKQAKQEAEIIAKHCEDGEFKNLTMPSPTPAVIKQDAPPIRGLSSVESTLKNIMDAMGKENNRIIGVLGMGGVGKTTVVKNLNNQLLGTQDFSKVIVVVVSKDPDMNRVQNDIAERLGLILSNDSSRASKIRSRLKQEKRFLIILDDLWAPVDLDSAGIPSANNLKDSKVIITTRKEEVCRKMADTYISVQVLKDEEPWQLFKEKAGEVVVVDRDVYVIANDVVQECAGLPLALITVGRALRNCTDLNSWKYVLRQLQDSRPDDIEDMEAKVYTSIRLSYELLQSELKPGFLFCCLYPEDYDIEIDRMVRQWIGEGFLEYNGDLENTIYRGHLWVSQLKASCLLLQGRGEGFVRMHDVVRDVGISIASKDKDNRSLVRTTMAGFKRLPKGMKWGEYKRVSLMQSKIKEPVETASWSQLRTLMLQENTELERIDGFLIEGRRLRVLDISSTAILQVPESLSNLTNLRVLCLRSCRLLKSWDLSPLRNVLSLQFVDLSDNEGLKELPRVIGYLRKLRSLDLTRTPHLAMLKDNILSNLRDLEELKMLQSFDRWGTSSVIAEFGSLQKLSCLFIEFVNMSDLSFLSRLDNVTKIEKFYIRLNVSDSSRLDIKSSQPSATCNDLSRKPDRCLEINGDSDGSRTSIASETILFSRTTSLAFTDCHFITGFPSAICFQSLKYLSIVKCTKLSYLLKKDDEFFSNLSCLELRNLPDIQTISSRLFPKLMDLHVSFCDKLVTLFSDSPLLEMKDLTIVKVHRCQLMETLFASTPDGGISLINLQTLILSDLPSMITIWKVGSVLSLQNLTTLSISSCQNLDSSVLSYRGFGGRLPNLVDISIVDCAKVAMVISGITDNQGLFPKLRKLKLDNLPTLQSVCLTEDGLEKSAVSWCSIEEIFVRRCPLLKELEPLLGGRKAVPLLEKIEVEEKWWKELEWGGDGRIRSQFQPSFIIRQ